MRARLPSDVFWEIWSQSDVDAFMCVFPCLNNLSGYRSHFTPDVNGVRDSLSFSLSLCLLWLFWHLQGIFFLNDSYIKGGHMKYSYLVIFFDWSDLLCHSLLSLYSSIVVYPCCYGQFEHYKKNLQRQFKLFACKCSGQTHYVEKI